MRALIKTVVLLLAMLAVQTVPAGTLPCCDGTVQLVQAPAACHGMAMDASSIDCAKAVCDMDQAATPLAAVSNSQSATAPAMTSSRLPVLAANDVDAQRLHTDTQRRPPGLAFAKSLPLRV